MGILSIPIIGTSIYNIKFCRQNVEYILTEDFVYNPFQIQQKYVDAYYEAAHRGHGSGKYLMASLDGCYLNVNIINALKNVQNDMIIIYGTKLKNEKEIVESYRKINPNISTIPLSETKFLPQLENPEKSFSSIEKFLL